MSAPFTIVALTDEDGDEFVVHLPGVYRGNRAADVEAALQLARESREIRPRGALHVAAVDYYGAAS
jgi:hypothetical protein